MIITLLKTGVVFDTKHVAHFEATDLTEHQFLFTFDNGKELMLWDYDHKYTDVLLAIAYAMGRDGDCARGYLSDVVTELLEMRKGGKRR